MAWLSPQQDVNEEEVSLLVIVKKCGDSVQRKRYVCVCQERESESVIDR